MRGNLSTSLLEGFTCSDAAQSDCENRTVVWKLLEKRHAGSWLSRLPLTKNWKIAGTFSQKHCSVFVGRWLQCSPAAPCWIGKSSSWLKKRVSRNETAKPSLRSFTSFQMIHTHTHPPAGGWKIKVRTVKWKWKWREMKMRWRWKWDESYLTRTRRGERNAEGKRKHQHKETWPTTGKPWKGKEKEKRRQTETEKDQRRGGRTDAPEPTYHSEPTPTSARAEPNLPGERRTQEHMK